MDVILLQERKLGPLQIETANKFCETKSYRSELAPAVQKSAETGGPSSSETLEEKGKGWSSGVAVLWKTWIAKVGESKAIYPSRVISVNLVVPGLGISNSVAVYQKAIQGIWRRHNISQLIRDTRFPCRTKTKARHEM